MTLQFIQAYMSQTFPYNFFKKQYPNGFL